MSEQTQVFVEPFEPVDRIIDISQPISQPWGEPIPPFDERSGLRLLVRKWFVT